ncbi:MAG TPA: hypothetical protein P5191_08260 [Ruminococcus sp.]|nr:hypothetical protein [Ruminococcus sp.]
MNKALEYAVKDIPCKKIKTPAFSIAEHPALFTYITAAYRPCAEAFAEAL